MRSCWLPVAAILVASPALAQDPVKVDPAHHALVFESDEVRVLRVTMKPGEKTTSHQHPAGVVVFLTDAHHRLTTAGAKPEETPRKSGDILALEAVTHAVENIGKSPTEVVLVELKAPAAGKPVKTDAVKADPRHYSVAAETDRVRVLRVRYGPGEKSAMHDHPALVAVALTDLQMRMHMTDGKVEEAPALKRGDVLYMPPASHAPENTAKVAVETVLVELKPR